MSKRIRSFGLILVVTLLMSLFLASAVQADAWGDNEGSLRGATYLDENRNGKMDPGEKGVGWVYFTISQGDYSHTYYSEWREQQNGHDYATGYFGPAPIPAGFWKVQFHVPEGYRATTPTEVGVVVPGHEGGHIAYVYLGLVKGSGGSKGYAAPGTMPYAGAVADPVVLGSLAFLGLGSLTSLGLGFKKHK
ncbi:MAG: hypothetical protein JXA21_26225 [Anaerolineae bacterium]|nr:hypothetical protein [Anaerolineae bacterium]